MLFSKDNKEVEYFEDLENKELPRELKEVKEIGDQIKYIRTKKGLSLEELSNLTGFEVELLSRIEKKDIQPQLGTIMSLSKALESAFGRLVSEVGDKIYSITRKNEQKIVHRSTSRQGQKKLYTYRSLAPEVQGRHMEALTVELEENPDEDLSVHEGEEFIYVIEGLVLMKIGSEVFELEEGDSIYYLSTTPHLITAKNKKAKVLAVLYR